MRSLNKNTLCRMEQYIHEFQTENGRSPSYRNIMHAMGISEEQWERCKQIREQRKRKVHYFSLDGDVIHTAGIHASGDVWVKKLKCRCGYYAAISSYRDKEKYSTRPESKTEGMAKLLAESELASMKIWLSIYAGGGGLCYRPRK